MGWLKKHLNPNPVKHAKTMLKDAKDSVTKPMAMLSGKKTQSASAASSSSTASKATSSVNTAKLPSYKQKQLGLLPGQTTVGSRSSKPTSTSGVYTTGQGKAATPKKITSQQIVPPVKTLRKSSARTSLNSMGTPGKNRFK